MNKTFLMSVTLILVASLLALYLYINGTRYQTAKGRGGALFEIDRVTGQSWLLRPDGKKLIEPEVEMTDESLAINLAVSSEIREAWRTPNETIASEEVSVRSLIQRLHNSNDTLHLIGWYAVKQDDQNFLVSYTVNKDGAARGYFFEVNVWASVVRFIPHFSKLIEKYGLSCDEDGICTKR